MGGQALVEADEAYAAELEEKSKDLGAVIEYFEPPAVPGYGAAAGFPKWRYTTVAATDPPAGVTA